MDSTQSKSQTSVFVVLSLIVAIVGILVSLQSSALSTQSKFLVSASLFIIAVGSMAFLTYSPLRERFSYRSYRVKGDNFAIEAVPKIVQIVERFEPSKDRIMISKLFLIIGIVLVLIGLLFVGIDYAQTRNCSQGAAATPICGGIFSLGVVIISILIGVALIAFGRISRVEPRTKTPADGTSIVTLSTRPPKAKL